MATEIRKVLGQASLPVATLTDIYTAPAQVVISTVTVCNRGPEATFRFSVAVAGEADDPKQYLYYDLPLPANDLFAFTFGISLGVGDVVRGYASMSTVTINLFGVEIV